MGNNKVCEQKDNNKRTGLQFISLANVHSSPGHRLMKSPLGSKTSEHYDLVDFGTVLTSSQSFLSLRNQKIAPLPPNNCIEGAEPMFDESNKGVAPF